MSESFVIRVADARDEPLLREMLYHAIFVPPGDPPLEREIVDLPQLAPYFRGFGRAGDLGLIAEDMALGIVLGAAWLRLWTGEVHGYGYVNAETPELSIAVIPSSRGRGIGSRLLLALLEAATGRYPAISLSVQPGNPALHLYRRFGFVEARSDPGSLVMLRGLGPVGPSPTDLPALGGQ